MTDRSVVIAGVEVTTDAEGRFNLNALHRASGGEKRNAPSYWLETKQAEDFIAEVSKQTTGIPVVSTEGRNGGTFAHELIAVEYAGWISPSFRIKVNQTFIDARMGRLQPTPPPQPLLPEQRAESIIATMLRVGDLCGVPRSYAFQIAGAEATKTTGQPWDRLLTQAGAMNDVASEDVMLEPSDLGERLGLGLGKEAGKILNRALATINWQVRVGNAWEPTGQGRAHCERHAWVRQGKAGYNLKWRALAVARALDLALDGAASGEAA